MPDDSSSNILVTVADSAGYAIIGAIISNVLLSVTMGVSVRKLWLLITTLQIIVHIPLLNIFLPANALILFAAIIDFSNMNLLPEYTMASMFSLDGNEDDEVILPGNF